MQTTAQARIRDVYERTARSVQSVLEDPKHTPDQFRAAARVAHQRAFEAAMVVAEPLSRTGKAGAEAMLRRAGIRKEAPL